MAVQYSSIVIVTINSCDSHIVICALLAVISAQ